MLYLPRAVEVALERRLSIFPAVAVTGARQAGKSTLVRVGRAGEERLYLTLDRLDVLDQARRSPELLVRRADRI